MKASRSTAAPVAYSYIRFSHPDQAKGDSLRRQTEAAANWCERNGAKLDTSTTFKDLGKSAYLGDHRKNPDRHAMAAFLKLVEDGKVPRGSYFIIENLDRLSREHIQPAMLLALNLLQAGVRVVQLKPVEMVFDDQSEGMAVMMMVMELSRGHGESRIKSERVGAAWAQKKQDARESGKVVTHRLPAWLEERDGKLHPIPDRVAIVRRIFALSANGYGATRITKVLLKEGVPPMGDSGVWGRSFIAEILSQRRVLGEYQPRKRNGTPDGPPVLNYFPAIITENEWYAARAAAAQRGKKPGRVANFMNVFANLVKNAREGDAYFLTHHLYRDKKGARVVKQYVLINKEAAEGRSQAYSFPYVTFERAVLQLLSEIDPSEILGRADAPDERMAIEGELARVEAKIAELETELLDGNIAALAKVLRKLEEQKQHLAEKLSQVRQREASPLSEAWSETQSLLATLENAPNPDDARTRLRSALRRIVAEIWLLVVPRGRDRLAAIQVQFADGSHCRNYLIYHQSAFQGYGGRKEGGWWARSLATVVKPGDLDLRNTKHVAELEAALTEMEITKKAG